MHFNNLNFFSIHFKKDKFLKKKKMLSPPLLVPGFKRVEFPASSLDWGGLFKIEYLNSDQYNQESTL